MTRWALAILVAVVAITGIASADGPASPRGAPPKPRLTSSGKTARGTLGSYCWSSLTPDGGGSGSCSDSGYPLPVHCSLPVKAGSILRVDTRVPARSISVALIQNTGGGDEGPTYLWSHGKRAGEPGRTKFRFRLPDKAPSAAVIEVDSAHAQGDANSWTGLDTAACRSSTAAHG